MIPYLVAVVLLGFVLFLAALRRKQSQGVQPQRQGRFEPRPPFTRKDQLMYLRLLEAFPAPAYMVLAAVNLGALLDPRGGASLQKYAHKRAGFVLLDSNFLVLAIFELDDNSANGNATSGLTADAMLRSAGYKVLHYRKLPDAERLRTDISKQVYSPQPA